MAVTTVTTATTNTLFTKTLSATMADPKLMEDVLARLMPNVEAQYQERQAPRAEEAKDAKTA